MVKDFSARRLLGHAVSTIRALKGHCGEGLQCASATRTCSKYVLYVL